MSSISGTSTALSPKQRRVALTGAASLAAFLLACSWPAQAVPILTISDGATTVSVVDGSVGDRNPLPGVVTYVSPVGANWSLVQATGTTKPQIGSAGFPDMDVNSVVRSVGAGTLTITWADTSFGPSHGSAVATIGGATAGSVSYATYADPANALALAVPLTSQGPFNGGAFSGAAEAALSLGSPYSLTMQAVITHATQGISSFDAELRVPDGGLTIGLLGSAVLGLEGMRRIVTKRKMGVSKCA
jgi:hypothetical protein